MELKNKNGKGSDRDIEVKVIKVTIRDQDATDRANRYLDEFLRVAKPACMALIGTGGLNAVSWGLQSFGQHLENALGKIQVAAGTSSQGVDAIVGTIKTLFSASTFTADIAVGVEIASLCVITFYGTLAAAAYVDSRGKTILTRPKRE
ncbi:MAG: hypothetical protein KGH78_02260 [Candidatus Micrarchaeota archaeon]|nr:hypothetical protein [Candidatus Micrarchaeota archaeon]